MRALAICLIGACYAPAAPGGVPCATGPGPRCPSDQTCVLQGGVEVCVRPGDVVPDADAALGDAEVDGSPFADSDTDGVADSTDNCRVTPNADQYNEDGDMLGDACDPCPPFAANDDADGDGVGDACDPNPATTGDVLVLFEGFNTAVPDAWTQSGSWAFENGNAVTLVAADATAYLAPPLVPDVSGTASAAVTSVAPAGAQRRSIGVANPFSRTSGIAGIECQLFIDGDQRRFGLFDIAQNNSFESTALAWTDNTPYVVRQLRANEQYRCGVDDQLQQDNASAFVLLSPAIAIRAHSIGGRFAWLMYVDSP